jgi:hypothetical protein
MSTEHNTRDYRRLGAKETGEHVENPGMQGASADETEAAGVIAEVPGDAAVAGESAAHDQRWHDVLANFVDDPRGAVLAATELVVNEVSAFVAVLDQRRTSMVNASPEDDAVSTENLRQVAATYRDISKQLTASTLALTAASRRDEPTRDDLDVARREVVGGRFDPSRARPVAQHRDAPPAQRSPREPSSQDQRR